MGGSSLAPEVLRRSFGEQPDGLRLHVLDSTDAAAVRAVEDAIDVDTDALPRLDASPAGRSRRSACSSTSGRASRDGSALRRDHRPGLGAGGPGRTSTASAASSSTTPTSAGATARCRTSGSCPAALMGADVEALLDGAGPGRAGVRATTTPPANSGLWLGHRARRAGAARPRQADVRRRRRRSRRFGLWVEQLVAESTGKQGKGILPVADEPLGAPDAYGDDRVFVHLRNAGDPTARRGASRRCATPASRCSRSRSAGPQDLGRIFFFAEFATAVAGWVLGINPFDQPNVQEAKDATKRGARRGRRRRDAQADDGDAAPTLLDARRRRTTSRSWATSQPTRRVRRGGRRAARARSATRRRRRRRSATARASCTRPASSTRAARRPGASCS